MGIGARNAARSPRTWRKVKGGAVTHHLRQPLTSRHEHPVRGAVPGQCCVSPRPAMGAGAAGRRMVRHQPSWTDREECRNALGPTLQWTPVARFRESRKAGALATEEARSTQLIHQKETQKPLACDHLGAHG